MSDPVARRRPLTRAGFIFLAALHLLGWWAGAYLHRPAGQVFDISLASSDTSGPDGESLPAHDEGRCLHCQSARAVSPPVAGGIAVNFVVVGHPLSEPSPSARLRIRSEPGQPRAPPTR